MQRRSLLSAILLSSVAPAIVRAESIAPIWVPKHRLSASLEYPLLDFELGRKDFTLESWSRGPDFVLYTAVKENNTWTYYVNGEKVTSVEAERERWARLCKNEANRRKHAESL
jgi:hypothetical protein